MWRRRGDRRASTARQLCRALLALLGGGALSACGARPGPPTSVTDAPGTHPSRTDAACVARFEAAVAEATSAGSAHARALEARAARIAEGHREAKARIDAARRSDAALLRWVGNHLTLKKLPCEPAGSDYLVGLRVTSRATWPLACELDEIGGGLAAPTTRKQATIEPGQTARLDTAVRSCSATDANAVARRRFVLTCHLSVESQSAAGIDDPRRSSFVYDLDTLELSGPPLPPADFIEPPMPASPASAPERAPFVERCLADSPR